MIRFCGSETQRKVNIPQRRRRKGDIYLLDSKWRDFG